MTIALAFTFFILGFFATGTYIFPKLISLGYQPSETFPRLLALAPSLTLTALLLPIELSLLMQVSSLGILGQSLPAFAGGALSVCGLNTYQEFQHTNTYTKLINIYTAFINTPTILAGKLLKEFKRINQQHNKFQTNQHQDQQNTTSNRAQPQNRQTAFESSANTSQSSPTQTRQAQPTQQAQSQNQQQATSGSSANTSESSFKRKRRFHFPTSQSQERQNTQHNQPQSPNQQAASRTLS